MPPKSGSAGSPHLECSALHPGLCPLLEPLLARAAAALELAADFFSLALLADDLPGADEVPQPWWQLATEQREGRTGWIGTLFCSETAFLKQGPVGGGLFPSAEIWDQAGAPVATAFDAAAFSEEEATRFLHHELLTARDLVRREIAVTAVPRGSVEAFSVAWAVTVDGRLHRLGLPGYSMAHRRNRFSRHFAAEGVLLPGHWEIFQSLWDGAIAGGRDVLAVLRHLPGG